MNADAKKKLVISCVIILMAASAAGGVYCAGLIHECPETHPVEYINVEYDCDYCHDAGTVPTIGWNADGSLKTIDVTCPECGEIK